MKCKKLRNFVNPTCKVFSMKAWKIKFDGSGLYLSSGLLWSYVVLVPGVDV